MDDRAWRELDPSHPRYRQVFRTYLAHTDEKERQRDHLLDVVDGLPRRDVFVDAGAGTGYFTAALAPRFRRTVAVEPDPALRGELSAACPGAEVLPVPISAAAVPEPADLVLCSHVLYYIPEAEWPGHLAALLSWVRPGGELVLVLQHPGSDCVAMARHFGIRTPVLDGAAALLDDAAAGRPYTARRHVQPASLRLPDLATALEASELVVGPLDSPDARDTVAAYLREHGAVEPSGGFALSCDQEFLHVRCDG
ncbi:MULTISPECIES: class I SAM-dependent methyltransferase [Streptomyces]|uniref:class I SAM-dependent methyltransferase n=1 Tax=Streptomyces TaxID=1883 RepID=UPI001674E516|nr:MULTISPECIES: methyltransferase domain-containing protein [Streptomyces]MBD3577675.1 class I SAM-dependent methyltransferase [Streptomyces sp. KD18]GGT09133.1 hypothetical protein GCM10010286_38110 [Streptomyces toxytricini]